MIKTANLDLTGSFGAGYNSGQQNRMAMEEQQTKLDQLKSDRQTMLQLQEQLKAAGKDPDLNKVFDAFIATGHPEMVMKGVEGKRRLKAQDEYAHLFDPTPTAQPPAAQPPAIQPPAAPALGTGMFGTGISNALAPAPTNALVVKPARPPMTSLGDNVEMANQTRARIDALMRFAGANAGMPEAEQAKEQAAMLSTQLKNYVREPNPTIQQYEYARGQGFTGTLNDFMHQHAPKPASTVVHNPQQQTPPVAVVDPKNPTKIIYVDRSRAVTEGLTPASAQDEGIAPKEKLKREAAYPQQTQAIKSVEANADNFIGDLTKLANHPGLDSITGLAGSRTPNLTPEARAAQALYDKVVAKGGFSILQAMRDASRTGGALGNLSDKEGAQLKAAFAAINQGQSTEDIKNALNEAIAMIQGSKARLREAYDTTYEYKNKDATAPAVNKGGATGSFDSPAGVDTKNPLLR